MNESKNCLINKTCIPCKGGIPTLTSVEIEKLLYELKNDWVINCDGHLYKEYKYSNFTAAMNFANKVAELEAHHPDLKVSWGICALEIWTHKVSGLTESDFKVEAINED